jgi:hypothetical protein
MAGIETHLAIADKIYFILGGDAIKNLPLFFGGNIAPDAVHMKKDYQRLYKKRSHLTVGVLDYGYGDSGMAKLFKDRVNEFIENYYLPSGEDKDLYLGYIIHLLTDEFNSRMVYKRLEEHLKNNGANPDEPGFRKNLTDIVYNGGYREFFSDRIYSIEPHKYSFKQNVVDVLEAAQDYEVKDYISADEINMEKRWIIDTYFKSEHTQDNTINYDPHKAEKFVDLAAENIIASLSGKNDITKIL